jgi:hypothetical protein
MRRQLDIENELRAIWTASGVPQAMQDRMIADIVAKARPGARIGPFVIAGEKK